MCAAEPRRSTWCPSCRAAPRHPRTRGQAADADAEHARGVLRSGRFVLLATVMTLAGFGLYAATINLVPLLTPRGFPAGLAALALGLVGAGQVAGRLCFGLLVRTTTPGTRTGLVLVTSGVAVVALAVVPGPAPALIGVAILAGAGRGLHTLLQASAVADRWGIRRSTGSTACSPHR